MIRLLLATALIMLACLPSDSYAQQSSTDSPTLGLYQSDFFTVASGEQRKVRMFVKIFPEARIALFVSPDPAEEINEILVPGNDMTADVVYEQSGENLVFFYGPTKHSVTVAPNQMLNLRSEFQNGAILEKQFAFTGLGQP